MHRLKMTIGCGTTANGGKNRRAGSGGRDCLTVAVLPVKTRMLGRQAVNRVRFVAEVVYDICSHHLRIQSYAIALSELNSTGGQRHHPTTRRMLGR